MIVGVLVYISGQSDFYGWRLLIVKSGSMEPTIKTGSLIFVRRETSYQKGDIVTYGIPNKEDTLVTHRIVEVEEGEQKKVRTKGDYNQVEDQNKSDYSMILGKYQFGVPYLGQLIGFAKTQVGVVLLVVIPGTIIIYDELLNIRKAVSKFFEKKKTNKVTEESVMTEKV